MRAAEEMRARVINARYSQNTVRNYRSAWKGFERWCAASGRQSLPATPGDCIDHICWCLAEGFRIETVDHRLKAANHRHRENGLPEPANQEVRAFLRKARRAVCEKPQNMHALTPEQLRRISHKLKSLGGTVHVRDRAVLLVCFACGWRRAELVSLDLEDVRWVDGGIVLWLGRTKTDQEARGRYVGVNYGSRALTCPVAALEEWLAMRGKEAGPLFFSCDAGGKITGKRLHPDGVRRAVKRGFALLKEDDTRFGAHSLRAGMITAGIENGASETAIMQRTGHRSYATFRRYVRPAQAIKIDPLKGVL